MRFGPILLDADGRETCVLTLADGRELVCYPVPVEQMEFCSGCSPTPPGYGIVGKLADGTPCPVCTRLSR